MSTPLPSRAIALGFAVALTLSAQPKSAIPGWTFSSHDAASYSLELDHSIVHGGKASASLRCQQPKCLQFGAIQQVIQSDEYVGKRLRLSAWLKGDKAGHTMLWMRILGPTSEVVNKNDTSRGGKGGTFDWQQQEVVLDVKPPGVLIYFGLMLEGKGQAWVDDVKLEIVPESVKAHNGVEESFRPTSNSTSRDRDYALASSHAVNLDFEQPAK